MKKIDWGHYDDMILYRDEEKYHELWKKRCSDCPAPCCFFAMSGYVYNYNDKKFNMKFEESVFFTYNFVVMFASRISNDELIKEWGFNLPLAMNAELNYTSSNRSNQALQICPLNINSQCLIYENRPGMCKGWKCRMKLTPTTK